MQNVGCGAVDSATRTKKRKISPNDLLSCLFKMSSQDELTICKQRAGPPSVLVTLRSEPADKVFFFDRRSIREANSAKPA